jgi:predicted CXXCH cytochrome family protein
MIGYIGTRVVPAGLAFVAMALALLALSPEAQATGHQRTITCLGCHGGSPRPAFDLQTGEMRDLGIDMTRFRGSDHGEVQCLECHVEGFHSFPHFGKKSLGCMECHPREEALDVERKYEFERIEEEFESTVHFMEHPEAFTCLECHDPHFFRATERFESPGLILRDNNAQCLRCHAVDAEGPLADPSERGLVADHAYLHHTLLHLRSTRCVECHSDTAHAVAHDLRVGQEARDCVACHTLQSVLVTRLYRYHGNEMERWWGFTHPTLLEDGYVMGATRSVALDWLTYVSIGGALLFVALHGTVRLVRRRKRGVGYLP